MQEPITVKAYGLIPLTKQTYLILQIIVLLGAAPLLLGVCILNYFLSTSQSLWVAMGGLTIIATIGEIIETVIMLRKFKQKEQQLAATRVDQPNE